MSGSFALDLRQHLREVLAADRHELVQVVELEPAGLDLGQDVRLHARVVGLAEVPADEAHRLLVRVGLLEPLEQARHRVVRRDRPGAPEVRLALTEGAGAAAAVEGEHLVLRGGRQHRAEVVDVGRELGLDLLRDQLGHRLHARLGVARLVVEVRVLERRPAELGDVLGGEVEAAAHRLAVERTGARSAPARRRARWSCPCRHWLPRRRAACRDRCCRRRRCRRSWCPNRPWWSPWRPRWWPWCRRQPWWSPRRRSWWPRRRPSWPSQRRRRHRRRRPRGTPRRRWRPPRRTAPCGGSTRPSCTISVRSLSSILRIPLVVRAFTPFVCGIRRGSARRQSFTDGLTVTPPRQDDLERPPGTRRFVC